VSASSSLLPPRDHERYCRGVSFAGSVTVAVRTLDTWAAQGGIDRVDFAWLDLQGMDLAVLQASPHVLNGLRAVSMEVCRKELFAGGRSTPRSARG
jgi:FkbM family methyltransferase